MSIYRYFFIIIFLLSAFNAKSTHIVGGEFNYKPVNDSLYEFSLKVYRDCYLGVPLFDYFALVRVFSGDGTFIGNVNVPRPIWDTLDVELTDPCLVAPPDVCVERIDYKFNVVLPPNSTGYQVSYQRCCRNQTILNAWDASSQVVDSAGATYTAFIPSVLNGIKNANPVFNNFPPVALCVNKPIVFDHSATDFDGDSLVYELCTPFDGGSTFDPLGSIVDFPPYDTLTWQPGYSLVNVLGGTDPLKIDPVTGLLTGTPQRLGQFVVGVCVSEYRNGALLSQTKRDFQFNIADCRQVVTSSFFSVDTSCNDRNVRFENRSASAVNYQWDFGDGNFSNEKNPIHTYSDFGVYEVKLIANPGSACVDTFSKTIYLTEDNLTISAPDRVICAFSPQEIELGVANGTIAKVEWNIGGVKILTLGPKLTYTYTSDVTVAYKAFSSEGCVYNGTFNVNIIQPPTVNATASPSSIVAGQSVSLSASSEPGVIFNWSPSQNIANKDSANTLAFPTDSQWYNVKVTDPQTGCYRTDSVFVRVVSCEDTLNSSIVFDSTPRCSGISFDFTASTAVPSAAYLWTFGDGESAEGDSVSHSYNFAGTYTVQLITAFEDICFDTTSVTVVTVPPDIEYKTGSYINCVNSSVLIDLDIQSERDYYVYWPYLDQSQPLKNTDTLNYVVQQSEWLPFILEDSAGCRLLDSVKIEVSSPGFVTASVDRTNVLPGETVTLSVDPGQGFTYQWSPANAVSDPNESVTTAVIVQPTSFIIVVKDSLGCTASDAIIIDLKSEDYCNNSYIFIPSAFSPNNDGKNDVWRVRSVVMEQVIVRIYNRWGELVFGTYVVDDGWDGTFKGEPAEAGVYGYVVEVKCTGGETYTAKGDITLMR